MPSESSKPQHSTTASVSSISEAECNADVVTERFAGKGWRVFDEMAIELDWRHSWLTAVLRWLRQKSPIYVVETKVCRGVVKVRITKVNSELKQARQLSTDIISQLAKLYSNLRHTDRNREKLAYDVKTIAGRIAPFLENREFQIQYRRRRRQRNEPQQETQMEASSEMPASNVELTHSCPVPPASPLQNDSPRFASVDRRALRRLTLIASIVVLGMLIIIFLTTTFMHAMELLSRYVERINSQI